MVERVPVAGKSNGAPRFRQSFRSTILVVLATRGLYFRGVLDPKLDVVFKLLLALLTTWCCCAR